MSAEQLQRKAEDLMNIVQQYAKGQISKPINIIEKEIAGFRAAISAVRTSYSLNPEIRESDVEGIESFINDYENETLPKQLGMGKGRNRKTYSQ